MYSACSAPDRSRPSSAARLVGASARPQLDIYQKHYQILQKRQLIQILIIFLNLCYLISSTTHWVFGSGKCKNANNELTVKPNSKRSIRILLSILKIEVKHFTCLVSTGMKPRWVFGFRSHGRTNHNTACCGCVANADNTVKAWAKTFTILICLFGNTA